MKKPFFADEFTIEAVVGGFIVMVFLGLGYFTIILSREAWFTKKEIIEVVFRNVRGLREGDSVVVRGMTIGKVKSLTLKPDGVHVVGSMDQPVRMKKDYRISVSPTSVLGGRHLEIYEGSDSARPVVKLFYRGEEPYDLMADGAALINAVKKNLVEGGTLENLKKVSEELRAISGRLNSGQGTLGKLLSADDSLYNDFSASVASMKQVSGRLERGEGTLGKLLSNDDTVYKDLTQTVNSLKEVSLRLERGESTLGRLLSKDDSLYLDLSAGVKSIRDISARIERGEGMFGRMLKDDSLYDEVKSGLTELRAAVDDFRETQPVTTFTSIFFGAF